MDSLPDWVPSGTPYFTKADVLIEFPIKYGLMEMFQADTTEIQGQAARGLLRDYFKQEELQ